jgi:retron-type reverse transcriptase
MVRAEITGVSSTIIVGRGYPQRGVVSSLLWNMVINSLLSRLSRLSSGICNYSNYYYWKISEYGM